MWQLGDHRLLCGDGTRTQDLRRVLAGPACDLVFTDLPTTSITAAKRGAS
jgi:hypothetical protein